MIKIIMFNGVFFCINSYTRCFNFNELINCPFILGHVILNSGEVRHNWLDLIRNLNRYDTHLKRIPALQAALSRSLCEIHVAQRRFRPELLAEAYESHLRNLTTSLGSPMLERLI